MKIITTSWDDGDMLDFKLAELLTKYNLEGTFYIPKTIPGRTVMDEAHIVALSKSFEIGGHTLDHVRVDVNDNEVRHQQIDGCYNWLNNLLNYKPLSFCFPNGKYNQEAINSVRDAGFKVARTTELLNVQNKATLLPTTIQVFEHATITLVKHLFIRGKWLSFIQWLQTNSLNNLLHLTESYIKFINKHGGCFHLWGHSWEIQEYGLWHKLEQIFKLLSNNSEFSYLQNKELANYNSWLRIIQ